MLYKYHKDVHGGDTAQRTCRTVTTLHNINLQRDP
jgi:hypothetical protein